MPQEIVFPAKNTFELTSYQDVPLGPNDVRGQTVATLVSQGTELAWANGDDFPIRPGYSAVFRVDDVGEAVTGVSKGDLRFCMGHHRSTQQYEARHTLLWRGSKKWPEPGAAHRGRSACRQAP